MSEGHLSVPTLTPPPGARVLLVGGAGAMGHRTTEVLLELGCNVVVLDTASSLRGADMPTAVEVHEVDLADEQSVVDAFAEAGSEADHLDGLINFAGFTRGHHPVSDVTVDLWDEIHAVNLRGAFIAARQSLPLLQRGTNPSMVLLSSVLGIETMPGYAPYGAAKAGLLALTRVLARENAPGIRVNAVAPGAVETPFLRGGTGRSAEPQRLDVDQYAQVVPMGRIAKVDDVVGPIIFLLSEASGYITGQTILVDGGLVPR